MNRIVCTLMLVFVLGGCAIAPPQHRAITPAEPAVIEDARFRVLFEPIADPSANPGKDHDDTTARTVARRG